MTAHDEAIIRMQSVQDDYGRVPVPLGVYLDALPSDLLHRVADERILVPRLAPEPMLDLPDPSIVSFRGRQFCEVCGLPKPLAAGDPPPTEPLMPGVATVRILDHRLPWWQRLTGGQR